MMKIYFFYFVCLTIPTAIRCQVATGIVVDSLQKAIQGVTVTVKGTKQITITDQQGKFNIKTTALSQTLQLSATGYNTLEVIADTKQTMVLTLQQKISSLDEVQVIAYGTTTQRYNVGSVTKVKAEDIERQPVSNPLAALQGRVPGLIVTATSGIPGASFTVQIRGQNTLTPSVNGLGVALPIDNPFFVIDGVPYAPQNGNVNQMLSVGAPGGTLLYNNSYGGSSPFNSINPSDIESIEVLRDADATAIYGSRGGNGVILITTKRGNIGKTNFTLNISDGASVVGKTMPMMNTQQYLMMRREAIANDGLTPNLTLWDAAYAPDLLAFDTTKYTNWKDYFLGNTAHNTVANASLSGGSQYTSFRLAAGFNRSTYIFPGDYADLRANFSVNLHHTSTNKRFSADFSSNYSYNKNNSSGSPNLLSAFRLEPNFPNLLGEHNNLVWSYKDVSLGVGIGNNPLSYLRNIYYVQNTMFNSNLQLGYKIAKDLSIKTNFGYNTFLGKEYFGNPFSAQNPLLSPEATASFGNNNYMTWIIEPQLEYRKVIKSSVFNILIGSTVQHNTNEKTQIDGTGYANDDLIESINAAPTIYANDDYREYKYAAVFGRINYLLQRKYIVNLNARRDGSSRFGPGKQFGNFGSIGGAWLFAEEGFIKQALKFLSYGKLRASYGITGSDAIGDYQYISRWASTPYPYNGTVGYIPQNLFNPLLGWASTKKMEVGFELGFLQDRILINSTWFRNRSGDQLISYYLPNQTGFGSVTENWDATVQNSGFEFVVQAQYIKMENFNWSSSFNISIPKNKLISFPGLEESSYALTYKIGKPLNTIYGFQYAGVNSESGLFQFKNSKGELTNTPTSPSGTEFNDYIVIGSKDPKFYGGLQNTISYRGVQLDVFLEFKKQLGVNYLQQVYGYIPGQEYNVPATLLSRWQKPGDVSGIQRFTSSYGDAARATQYFYQSSGVYSDASYIRFKTINLSYNFNNAFLNAIGLKNLRIYGAAQNLFTISNYLGNDPETQSIYSIPVLKTFVFGLQLTL